MPLLNDIFLKGFGQEEINKKVISDQGWNTLNQKLVEHPSISVNCNTDNAHFPQAPLHPLNFENAEEIGMSVLDQIMRKQAKMKEQNRWHASNKKRDTASSKASRNLKKCHQGSLPKMKCLHSTTSAFSAQNKKQLTKPRNNKKSSIQISTRSKLHATNMDMNRNTCSKNLIYPNVLLTYNINAPRRTLKCPHQLAREGNIASNWCNSSLWHHPHMPAMMMEPVLPVLTWMLSMHWWVSFQAQWTLVFMNMLFSGWLLLLILLMAQLIGWTKIN